MRFLLYVGGWTVVCLVALLPLRGNPFWPVAVVAFGFVWLVGIPIALLYASQRMTESLPEDDDQDERNR
jgi:hypothetical protein